MKQRYGSTSRGGDGSSNDERESLLDVAHCDHYEYDNDIEGGGGLTSMTNNNNKSSSGGRSSSSSSSCWRSIVNCLILPLFLAATASAIFSYYLQTKITNLSTQLYSLNTNVQQLSNNLQTQHYQLEYVNETLINHSSVIKRFEHSVSNSDVLTKLQQLEEDSIRRQHEIELNLNTTKSDIETTLSQTQRDIDITLQNATNTINSQVNSVQTTLSSYIRDTQDQFSTENSFMVYQLAGTFTLLGCLITMWHMTSHLRNFHQPYVQRKILAILWMCPIYSVTSWLSLVIPVMEGYLAILKDLYEAYVIYQFLSFLIAVLEKGNRSAVVDLLARHADHLSPPVRCFGCCRKHLGHGMVCNDEKRQLAEDVLTQCQVCAMQFVLFRPLLTAVGFVLKKIDYTGPLFGPGNPFDTTGGSGGDHLEIDGDSDVCSYGGGMIPYCTPQFWLIIAQNVSVFLAFSGLLNFYHAVAEDLSWCRPFPKFLCIKGEFKTAVANVCSVFLIPLTNPYVPSSSLGVVFMTFWQSCVITLLAESTDILGSGGEAVADSESDQEKYAKQAQNFLICLEMLGFSIAHFYCFPVEEWEDGYRPEEDQSKFGDKMALGDFLHDLKLIMRRKSKKKRAKDQMGSRSSSVGSFSTVPEEDEEVGALLEDVEGLLLEEESSTKESSAGLAAMHKSNSNTSSSPHKEEEKIVLSKTKSPLGKVDSTSPRSAGKVGNKSPKSAGKVDKEGDLPYDLRQARALLLESSLLDENTASLLTSDMMHQLSNERQNEEDTKQADGEIITEDGGQQKVDCDGEEDDFLTAEVLAENTNEKDKEEASAESSSLLGTSPNDQMLQPSIFTMHSRSFEEE
jgi:hypothetical protein